MGIKKTKVSELPAATSLDGLVVLGVDDANKSVKVGMDLLKGNAGADAFTVWQRQPGNEGKTFEDYMTAIKGDKGNNGTSFNIIGLYPTLDDLEKSVPDGSGIDGVYGVGTEAPYTYYAWVDVDGIGKWASQGQLQGGDGKSAYDIAVQSGFIGTEAEWLASLKGKDATETLSPDAGNAIEIRSNGLFVPGLKPATVNTLGGIKVGNNLTMRADGTLDAAFGSGTGDGVLTLPYVAPERDSDGNITNSAAYVDAWGGILAEYLAAPDSHALYMEIDAGDGLMLRMPCNLMNMGGEADAVQWLISGFGVVNVPMSPSEQVSCKATCMANVVCNAAGEMQSLVMYASEGIARADGKPNLLGADDALIVKITSDATEEQLKAIMQPVLAALQVNPTQRVVIDFSTILLPAATYISNWDMMIMALNTNPLAVGDLDNNWIVKAQVYCKLSNGVIESATGGVTGYELATTEAMTAALAGKAEKDHYHSHLVPSYSGSVVEPPHHFNRSIGLKVAMFGNLGLGSSYVDAVWINGYSGLDVPNCHALLFPRDGSNEMYLTVQSTEALAFGAAKRVWHSGNLNPATAASVGLMSAEDKIKLNSVASAMSLTVQTADTPVTLNETDAASSENAVASEISVRAQRAAQYQMQADELLYDALEAFARNHPEHSEFAAWLEAKDRIRQELPKPQEGGAE